MVLAGRARAQEPAWSPLATAANLARALTRAPDAPGLLLSLAPRLALFWTVGNPGAVAYDVDGSRTEFRAERGGENGDYRRPLDPARLGRTLLSGLSWQPLGDHASAVGRVVFDQRSFSPGSYANLMEPYPSSPIVTTDSTTPDYTNTTARLEGAMGWGFGRVGFGFAPGYEVRDVRTAHPRLARIGRHATAGGTLGAVVALPWWGLHVGAAGRWVRGRETVRVIPQGALVVVFPLYGYGEPDTLSLGNIPYFREAIRNGSAWGLDISGTVLGATWIATWRRERFSEEQTSQQKSDPALDTWKAAGSTLGFSAMRAIESQHLLATVHVRRTALTGSATRFDLTGAIFRATESALDLAAEVRVTPPLSPWSGAASLGTRRESRARNDYLGQLRAEISSWTPNVAVEVARMLDSATSVAVGVSYAPYYSSAAIPNPGTRGPLYLRLIGPELAVSASQAAAQAATVTARRRISPVTSLWVRLRYEQLKPGGTGVLQTTVPLRPSGDRAWWTVGVGAMLGN